MWIGIISLFPEIFDQFLKLGVLGRGIDCGLIKIDIWNPRDFSDDPNKAVDDKPYGGGPHRRAYHLQLCLDHPKNPSDSKCQS